MILRGLQDRADELQDLSILHPVESGLAGDAFPILSADVSASSAPAIAAAADGDESERRTVGPGMISTTTIITCIIIEGAGGIAPSTRAVPARPLEITTPPTDAQSMLSRIRMCICIRISLRGVAYSFLICDPEHD